MQNPVYACTECSLTFQYGYLLTRHRETHSHMKTRISCSMKICKYNEYFFKSKQVYFRHTKKAHGIVTYIGIIEYLYPLENGQYHELWTYQFDRINAEPLQEQNAHERAYQIMLETFPHAKKLDEKRQMVRQEIEKNRPAASFIIWQKLCQFVNWL